MSEHRLTRRDLLRNAGIGLGAMAVSGAAGLLPASARPLLGGGIGAGEPLRLARVWPATPVQRAALWAFDDTHMVWDDGSVELLLWPGDLPRLDGLGIRYQVTVSDLAARDAALREGGAGQTTVSAPGQTSTYRRLGDGTPLDDVTPTFNGDLRYLAETYPDRVRLFALPEPSLQGRTVYGVEICTDVGRDDGRPVFYMDGLHHAREWPSGEFTIMFAFDLVENYGADARITAIMDNARTVLVPVQNPDGFVRSRDALTSPVSAYTPVDTPLAVSEFEYHRKNMRRHTTRPEETGAGVDTNRNYGLQWGGDGSSGSVTSQTYRGATPFSEPEARNIRALLAQHHVIALNSNHTSGRLILRPPGAQFFGTTPDDELMKDLGDAMAAVNGYRSQYSWQLYDTTGTTMDWGYGAHGALSYTFEHATSFHPNYPDYIPAGYELNREPFLLLAEAAASPANCSVIAGRAVDVDGSPVPAEIRVGKTFDIPLWRDGDGSAPTGEESVTETVDTRMEAPDGAFGFRVNPSRRPYERDDGEPYTVVMTAADGRGAERTLRVARGQTVDLGDVTLS